jgi:uncharacterized protein YggE
MGATVATGSKETQPMSQRFAVKAAILAFAIPAAYFSAVPAFAADDEPKPRTITVSGQGEVKSVPDEAQLSAGVVTQAQTAADALAANSRMMNRVFTTLKQLGIPDKAMQTSEFSVSPQYQNDRNGNATPKIIGYQVSNNVSVTVNDLAKLGPTIDVLVGSGANTLGSVSFGIRDPKPLDAKAREAAVHDAMDKAAQYATAAGLQLGPILSIEEGSAGRVASLFQPRMMAALPEAPPPIAAGEESASASVSVTFEIR